MTPRATRLAWAAWGLWAISAALGAELRRVIAETLAPAYVSAWLRQRSSGR